jgi:hypothetical protein
MGTLVELKGKYGAAIDPWQTYCHAYCEEGCPVVSGASFVFYVFLPFMLVSAWGTTNTFRVGLGSRFTFKLKNLIVAGAGCAGEWAPSVASADNVLDPYIVCDLLLLALVTFST